MSGCYNCPTAVKQNLTIEENVVLSVYTVRYPVFTIKFYVIIKKIYFGVF